MTHRGKSQHFNSKSSRSTSSSACYLLSPTPSIIISQNPSFNPLLHLIYSLYFTRCTRTQAHPLPSKAPVMRDVSSPGRILLLGSASQETFPFSRNSQDFTSCLFSTAEPSEFTARTKPFSNHGYRPQQPRGLVAREIPRSLAESMKVIFFFSFLTSTWGTQMVIP